MCFLDLRIMQVKISLQEVLTSIDQSIHPFTIQFSKSNGELREMLCLKGNRNKGKDKRSSHENSRFRWNLNEKHALILEELIIPTTPTEVPGLGTVHKLPSDLDLFRLDIKGISRSWKTPKIYSLREYNGKLIYV